MPSIHAISLGCPKNRVDTETLLAGLRRYYPDMEVVAELSLADVIIINTCGFIEPAVEESVRTILDAAAELDEAGNGSRPLLVVTGCLPGRYGVDELAKELVEVDLFLGPMELGDWPEKISTALGQRGISREAALPGAVEMRELSTGPSYAYLKISEGCDRSCSFCTIPAIRGPFHSRPMAELEAEARELLDKGVKELVLVGQDVSSYGKDLQGPTNLITLLETLLPLEGLHWLRPMYLYPAGLTPELLGFMRDMEQDSPLVPYFDVPLQHAHEDILKAMGRPFSRDPHAVVERIRSYLPHAALRTSLIVGFPGESETHFTVLKDFVIQSRFHNLGVFPFWPEQDTVAANLSDQVDQERKSVRQQEIMALQADISAEILGESLGEELDVLVDAPHPDWPGLYTGRAWFQAPEVDGVTYVSGPGVTAGAMVRAVIEDTATYDLTALT
ncbi:MAG: 30S ribosomal protein S12 methylthiotransferase RimO [Desulfovibrio sp.]|nr:MAG: 30S ribosomal protein S12 methylthiotransferase RimO [Desulfovibrio sp.]